jgi:putative tryptophan/tyrosine transport system substrate-binding protein
MMKIFLGFICSAFVILGFLYPCCAEEKTYRIEVLQITDLILYRSAYEGFVKGLEKCGLVQGKNVVVNRTVIEFDILNPSLWNKLRGVMRIRSEASRIAHEKPDLALTIGAPVTEYAKSRITGAGIPLVFTAVTSPTGIGSRSPTEGGPGFTGATSSMDIGKAMEVVRLVFPKLTKVGIVHSVDDFARIGATLNQGQTGGITILTKQVGIGDPILPALEDLQREGAEAFAVPPDPYYTVMNGRAVDELIRFSRAKGIPIISLVIADIPGAVLSVGVDLEYIGELSAYQAARILKEGIKPEALPILKQNDLTIKVDEGLMKDFGVELPQELRSRALPSR